MRPGIDVIVTNYRTPHDLKNFLTSLKFFPPGSEWSLYIMNVDPLRADVEAAFSCGLPFSYSQFKENVGYAKAVNHAATLGNRETIAIFNADVVLLESVLQDCHEVLQSKTSWGILGPRQVDSKGLITHGGFVPNERGFHQPNSHEFSDVREDAVTVSGSAYFIKRTVWEELTECPVYRKMYPEVEGAFLPTQHYYEETWCSYHARLHDHKVVYYGPVVAIHEWHKASHRGSWVDKQIPIARQMFEEACEAHANS